MTTAKAYLDVQRSQLGVKGGSPNGNHTIYGAYTGYQDQAWCGSFQAWAAHQCGLVLPAGVAATIVDTHVGYAQYRKDGRDSRVPVVGAHVFYDWSGSKNPSNIHHVECVESILSSTEFITIGGNVNSQVQRVRRSLNPYVVGFGLPVYSTPPVKPPPPVRPPTAPRVSLSRAIYAARHDPSAPQGHTTYPGDVRVIEGALRAEGLLAAQYAGDGSYGTLTVNAYSKWQQRLGYHGADADGVPGTQSLTQLGRKHGFVVIG